MAIVNIYLPDNVKEFIDERVKEGDFSSTNAYFRDLVRKDQKRRAQERLEALLLEGLDGGEPIEVTDEYIQKKRAELLDKIKSTSKPDKPDRVAGLHAGSAKIAEDFDAPLPDSFWTGDE